MEPTREGLAIPSVPTSGDSNATTDTLTPQQAMQLFQQDPVGFIQEVLSASSGLHLSMLHETIQMEAALQAARKTLPEFSRFEPYILQELGALVAQDQDGILPPWSELIDQAVGQFRQRLAQLAQSNPQQVKAMLSLPETTDPAHPVMEATGKRATRKVPQEFSRRSISKMSLEEFIANEAAINQAMKEKRIK